MLELAKENIIKEGIWSSVDLILGDAHKLPLKRESIGLIVSTETLHHIRKPYELSRGCMRVLKDRHEAWIYEFSHDINVQEAMEFIRKSKMPPLPLKLASLMHGIPRREFKLGYIRKCLELAKCNYEVKYYGFLTKLIICK